MASSHACGTCVRVRVGVGVGGWVGGCSHVYGLIPAFFHGAIVAVAAWPKHAPMASSHACGMCIVRVCVCTHMHGLVPAFNSLWGLQAFLRVKRLLHSHMIEWPGPLLPPRDNPLLSMPIDENAYLYPVY